MVGLLDLNDDILNKIKHELDKLEEREKQKNYCFKNADEALKDIEQYKKNRKLYKIELGEIIYTFLYKCCITDKEINEYTKSRNLDKYF